MKVGDKWVNISKGTTHTVIQLRRIAGNVLAVLEDGTWVDEYGSTNKGAKPEYTKEDTRLKSWEFKTSTLIDFDEVFKDLSRENPIGVVSKNGEDGIVVGVYNFIAMHADLETNTDFEYDKFTLVVLPHISELQEFLEDLSQDFNDACNSVKLKNATINVSYPKLK